MVAKTDSAQTVHADNLRITDAQKELLPAVSFSALPGQIHVISGQPGSGKTLCARALCDLLPDTLTMHGNIVCENAVYVGEDPDSQVVTLSVEDEVASALEFRCVPAAEINARVRESLERLGLIGLEKRNPWTLSGGQRQRLALAGAFACKPAVLVLDNPCANIDPEGRQLVYRLLREQADQGTTVILFEQHAERPAWADAITQLPSPHEAKQSSSLRTDIWRTSPKQKCTHTLSLKNISLGKECMRLAGVSLDLESGTLYQLVGHNGCGKTSLMAVLAGAVKPQGGTLCLNKQPVRRLPDGLVAWAQQNPERQFTQTTVKDEIALARKMSEPDGPLSPEQLDDLPAALELAELEPELPYMLSASKKRRLGILLALLENRPVLLLDEPTASLGESQALNQILHVYTRSGGIVVASSHDTTLLDADSVINMSAGSIVYSPCDTKETAHQRLEERSAVDTNTYPPFNPLAVVAAVLWLIVLGVVVQNPAVIFVLSGVCILAAAAWHKSIRKLGIHIAIVLLAGGLFSVIALRNNWAGAMDGNWLPIAHHGALGSIFLAASLWAGSLVQVSQLADAVCQRLHVPYTWCTLALAGTSIASFLRNVSSLISTAVRLRSVRMNACIHNARVRLLLPFSSALPLFIESIRHAQRLHTTLMARSFGMHSTRTFRVQYPWRMRDAALLVALVGITFAACIA